MSELLPGRGADFPAFLRVFRLILGHCGAKLLFALCLILWAGPALAEPDVAESSDDVECEDSELGETGQAPNRQEVSEVSPTPPVEQADNASSLPPVPPARLPRLPSSLAVKPIPPRPPELATDDTKAAALRETGQVPNRQEAARQLVLAHYHLRIEHDGEDALFEGTLELSDTASSGSPPSAMTCFDACPHFFVPLPFSEASSELEVYWNGARIGADELFGPSFTLHQHTRHSEVELAGLSEPGELLIIARLEAYFAKQKPESHGNTSASVLLVNTTQSQFERVSIELHLPVAQQIHKVSKSVPAADPKAPELPWTLASDGLELVCARVGPGQRCGVDYEYGPKERSLLPLIVGVSASLAFALLFLGLIRRPQPKKE